MHAVGIIKFILYFVLLLICAYTDYKKGKIYNKYVFTFLIIFILLSILELVMTYITNIEDLPLIVLKIKNNFLGFLLTFIISFIFYLIGVFRGGDAKLLSIVGLCSGLNQLFDHLTAILIVAGIVALFVLIKHKILLKKLKRVFLYFRGLLLTGYFEKYTTDEDNDVKFPFAVYILLGEIITYLIYFGRS